MSEVGVDGAALGYDGILMWPPRLQVEMVEMPMIDRCFLRIKRKKIAIVQYVYDDNMYSNREIASDRLEKSDIAEKTNYSHGLRTQHTVPKINLDLAKEKEKEKEKEKSLQMNKI